nr:hypothetical protein [Neobacillus sp. Marseille-Q6967]
MIEDLYRFTEGQVEILIRDEQDGEQAPAVKKQVKKVQPCPDGTHIRFYFDHHYFLAVPIDSTIIETETMWSATHSESGLTYTIKKVQVEY